MIVQESDILLAALDRRLQVDRITSLDPLTAIGRAPLQDRTPPSGVPGPATPPGGVAPPSHFPSTVTSPLAARLPLGSIISARVTAVPQADHVVAEVGSLRIELAWPAANGTAPRTGSDIALRVLAHTPMLLFQRVGTADAIDARAEEPTTRWSSDAIRLQAPASTRTNGTGPVRFDAPILAIEIVPHDPRRTPDLPASSGTGPEGADRQATQPGLQRQPSAQPTMPFQIPSQSGSPPIAQPPLPTQSELTQSTMQQPSPSHAHSPLQAQPPTDPPSSLDLSRIAAVTTLDPSTPIALDDVVVARHTAFIDSIATPLVPRNTEETKPAPLLFSPLVMQGPAWPGQPVELIVRREREDEQFDNPVLDHWCGEVTIDLPNLGRVAAHLSFSMKGLKLRIEGDESVSVDAMTGAAPALASALAEADMRVATLTIAQPAADALRSSVGADAAASVAFRRSRHD